MAMVQNARVAAVILAGAIVSACGGERSDLPDPFAIAGAKALISSTGGSCEVGAQRVLVEEAREYRVTQYELITYDDAIVAADRRRPNECPNGAVGRLDREPYVFEDVAPPLLADYQRYERACEQAGNSGKPCQDLADMRQRAIRMREVFEARLLNSRS